MGKVFAVGVGPGSPDYVTETVRKIIVGADVVVGYEYTLKTIFNLVQDKKVHTITMESQEKHTNKSRKIWVVGFWLCLLQATLIFPSLKLWID